MIMIGKQGEKEQPWLTSRKLYHYLAEARLENSKSFRIVRLLIYIYIQDLPN
jgi:hypothetical protein